MRPKTPKLLEDIRDAAAYIGELAQGRTLEDCHRIVWSAIAEKIPVLLIEVESLLGAGT